MLDSHTDTAALRRLLAERQLTQAAFAARTGLSYGYVKKIAVGRRDLSLRAAGRVAAALDVPIDAFTHSGTRAACHRATCHRLRRAAA